jgi:DNA-binding IscR family transcriptional regulator
MSTYVVRVRPGRRGGPTLLGASNSRELAREVVRANECRLTHFQPSSRHYPMTLVCEAEDNLAIARVLRSLDVFGYVETETAKIA